MVAIGACLGAVGSIGAMNGQKQSAPSLQNVVVEVLYHEKRGQNGHILDLKLTADDMPGLLQPKEAEPKYILGKTTLYKGSKFLSGPATNYYTFKIIEKRVVKEVKERSSFEQKSIKKWHGNSK